ncbi:hypothetical protein QQF64_021901 [Cirrhinus molitorella]|uniref:Uncharacterized protein n=1 Tax=Cirrhinus molitorella TaxID=172907 RepID=A0ABR3LAM5_9TELE
MTQRSEAASVSVHVLSKQGNLGHVKGSAHKHSPPPPTECTLYSVKHPKTNNSNVTEVLRCHWFRNIDIHVHTVILLGKE